MDYYLVLWTIILIVSRQNKIDILENEITIKVNVILEIVGQLEKNASIEKQLTVNEPIKRK